MKNFKISTVTALALAGQAATAGTETLPVKEESMLVFWLIASAAALSLIIMLFSKIKKVLSDNADTPLNNNHYKPLMK